MKLAKLLAGLLLAITIAIPVVQTGCKLPDRPAQTIALDSLETTYNVTRDAYKTGLRLWRAGRIKDSQKEQLDVAWNDFRGAMDLAVRAAGVEWKGQSATPQLLVRRDNILKLSKL